MKSGNLNFPEPSGKLQACNGTALPLYQTCEEQKFSQQGCNFITKISV